MKIIECIHTQSDCYMSNTAITPIGIVVHSTGANNPTVRRYSQPSTDDPNREELLALIGTHKYNNHWNREEVKTSVHYFLGKIADGSIASVRTIPETMAVWGVGKGTNGSYNYNPTAHIQFEMCEDSLTDENYFNAIMKEAQELCADICLRYNWDSNVIVSHKEAHFKGYASNHRDCDHWLAKFDKNMDWFRSEVQTIIDKTHGTEDAYTPVVGDIVNYVGNVQYRKSNDTKGYKCKPGLAKVTSIYNGKHPYHLVNTVGDSAYVYGWVDGEFIRKYEAPVVEDPKQDVEVVEPVTPPVVDPVTPPVVEDNTKQNFIKQLITLIMELVKKLFTKKK